MVHRLIDKLISTSSRGGRLPLLLPLMLLLSPGGSYASDEPISHESVNRAPETAKFFDEQLLDAISKDEIQGAVLGVVHGGEVVFLKGYGYSDRSQETLMNPEETVVRAGSVSKLFTAMVFLKTAEKGLLDPQKRIGEKIGVVSIPKWSGKVSEPGLAAPMADSIRADRSSSPGESAEITPVDLFTHSAGFDERLVGLASRKPESEIDLGKYLKETLPPRIRAPGEYYSYSNHSIVLGAYMAEVAEETPFQQLAHGYIFEPLQMNNSSFFLEDRLKSNLAMSYARTPDGWTEVPHLPIAAYPAGSLYTTAEDMTRFLLLNIGSPAVPALLSPGSLSFFHSTHWQAHPKVPGSAFAFYERIRNEKRFLEHAGDWEAFSSHFIIHPQSDSGYFISINGSQNPMVREKIARAWIDRFFPSVNDTVLGAKTTGSSVQNSSLDEYAGRYRVMRYEKAGLMKVLGLPFEISVSVAPENRLRVDLPFGLLAPIFMKQTGEDLFEGVDENVSAYFHRDSDKPHSPVVAISTRYMVLWTLEKIGTLSSFPVQSGMIFFSLVVFLLVLFTWPIAAYRARRKRQATTWTLPESNGEAAHFAQKTLYASWTLYGSVVWFFLYLFLYLTASAEFILGPPPYTVVVLWMPVVSAIFFLALLRYFPYTRGSTTGWGLYRRLLYTNTTVAHALFLAFAWQWNLMAPALL